MLEWPEASVNVRNMLLDLPILQVSSRQLCSADGLPRKSSMLVVAPLSGHPPLLLLM